MPATDAPIICRASGLTKVYPMGDTTVQALRGVDLELRKGEFLVMLGPSGSGKSTLLNILGGLDVPSSGQVHWDEHDLSKPDEKALTRYRREHVGFVFQFYNLIPSLTALENVRLVAEVADNPLDAEEALGLVGLIERKDHFPSQLSGGEQQRVAVARAIAKRPDLLLCDEPTGALDHLTGQLVLKALKKINEEMGTTTVVITHNMGIGAMGDRILRLADGRIQSMEINPRRRNPEELTW